MRNIFRFILLLFVIFSYSYSFCQFSIKGKVIDSKTKEPLAFVNIIFNSNPHLGTTTDIDGRFYFSHSQKITTFSCSYLGYENLTVSLDSIRKQNNLLIIELVQSAYNLQEVVVKPGENPANNIIKKVIQNKRINNPENISSFKYTSYNKSVYDFSRNDTVSPDTTNSFKAIKADESDSIEIAMDKLLKGGHFLIMESVTERKYISPGINEEIITGARVSGFKHPSFAPLATNMQPFSFYKDLIKIFDVNYLNPISNGSLEKYRFNIEDTLYQNNDTVFIISFKPLAHKNFEALTGLLYINTNKFAIQNVIAEPFKKGFIDIKIQQQYTFIDNKQWFPKQLNFEMTIRQYPTKKIGTIANGKSYIENVELFSDLDKKDFSLESVKMHELATERDSVFWNKYRTEPLNKKELTTYQVIDSFGEKNKFEALLRLMEKISQNKIPVRFIDLEISKILLYNKYEGTRLGLGAYTNEKILKFFSVGGFFGYGLKDNQWKYGGELILKLIKEKELEIRGKYQINLREAGGSDLSFFNQNYYSYRTYLAYRMDRIQQSSFSIGFRAVKYAKLNFILRNTEVIPQYGYEFQTGNLQKITSYSMSDITINLRYAYKEKLIKSLNQRVSTGTKYPIIYLTYSKGMKDFYNGRFDFNKIEARIEKSFTIKNLGETNLRMEGGYIDKSLPYGLLYTGEGSFDGDMFVLIKNSFQTALPYEFLSDRYINFYFSHNFGSLLFQINKFKPHITLHQNMGWGMLSRPEDHKTIEFKTKEKGFYETGLQFDNIVKLNYYNIVYLGFGAGVYYKYGQYANKNMQDNLAFKFSMTFTTK